MAAKMSRVPSLLRRIASLSFSSSRSTPAIVFSPQLSLSSSSFSSSSRFDLSSVAQPPSYSSKPSDCENSISPSPSTSNDNDDVPSDVSTEELKQRIGKYLEGDVEALPSIFEAILARKLSGKHEDTDDELMEDFRSKAQHDNKHMIMGLDGDDKEFDSDEDLSDSDSELSDSEEDLSESNDELSN